MMANMASPTKKMKGAMDDLGLSLTNSDGTMKSYKEVMDDMRSSFGGLSETQQAAAAATIFGKEAMAGSLAIVNASAADYDKLSGAINNSEGSSARMAETMSNTLGGKWKEFMSVMEGVAITIYEEIQPALKSMVENASAFAGEIPNYIEKFIEVWPKLKEAIITAGVAFVTFKSIMAGLFIMSKLNIIIRLYRSGMLATAAAQWILNAAMLANPIGLVVAGIAGLVAIGVLLYRNWDTVSAKAGELWTILTEKFTAIKDVIMDKISSAISGALTFFSELPGKVAYWLGYMIAKTITFLSGLPDTFKKWFGKARDGATDIISELPGKIADFLAEIPGKASGIISDVIAKFKELGSSIPNAIADGFNAAKNALGGAAKWALDKIIGGVGNLKQLGSNVLSGFSGGFAAGGGAQIDGSHYNGLDRVPYNGYVAKLHKGERVMTAAENKSFSAGKGSSTVNLTVHYNGGQKLDEQEMSRFTNYLVKNLATAGAGGA